jgi:hypothetical protein
VHTMVCWTLRGFVCVQVGRVKVGMNVSFAVLVGESASALGDRREGV